MRHRIRDTVNTVLELGAELLHDYWVARWRRALGIVHLEERQLELEREWATRSGPARKASNPVTAPSPRPTPIPWVNTWIVAARCPACGKALARQPELRAWVCENFDCGWFGFSWSDVQLEERHPHVLTWSEPHG